MIRSCDAGSLPFPNNNMDRFLHGASSFGQHPEEDSVKFFEEKVITVFLDKIRKDVDVPNYPQFRDMNEMFLEMIEGVERVKEGYIETKVPCIRADRSQIQELLVIKRNSKTIRDKKGEPFQVKVCVTGPYTLSSRFVRRDNQIFGRLGDVISQIVKNNIFSGKNGSVDLIAVDEPVFGMLDDPLIDYGSDGRENLQNAWESIFKTARSMNAQTLLHLHNTSDELFWEMKSLNLIDSHVDDPIYQMRKTREQLELNDKFLKASISRVEFDTLMRRKIIETSGRNMSESEINEETADTWKSIKNREIDPKIFLEKTDLVKKRLADIVDRFGVERVPYAGPECGPKGFPTYECALECLRRVSSAVKAYSKTVQV